VAHLPVLSSSSPKKSLEKIKAMEIVAFELAWEGDRDTLVAKLAKGDPAKAKRWRMRLTRYTQDEDFQRMYGSALKAIQMLDLGPAVRALGRRAAKGNLPAIKLALEASGFYNPRMEHHHSGKIEIELKGVNRPSLTVDESEAITDATVVE
jgi:hypothetical protein